MPLTLACERGFARRMALGLVVIAPLVGREVRGQGPEIGEERAESALDLDRLEVAAFVEGVAQVGLHPSHGKGRTYRAFDLGEGLFFRWLGVDLRVAQGPVSLTVDARAGDAASEYAVYDDRTPLRHLKQLFVAVDFGLLRLELGKMDGTIGIENAESWTNHSHSRGLLDTLSQPNHHTGVRAWLEPTEDLEAHLFVVTGWDTTLDVNDGKSFGGGLTWSAAPTARLSLTYMGGPEQPKAVASGSGRRGASVEGRLRHLLDLVASWDATPDLQILVNSDVGLESGAGADGDETVAWSGVSASARQRLLPELSVAARGELFGDPTGHLSDSDGVLLGSATATLDYRPVDFVVLRVEARVDLADRPAFLTTAGERSSIQPTGSSSLVVRTP